MKIWIAALAVALLPLPAAPAGSSGIRSMAVELHSEEPSTGRRTYPQGNRTDEPVLESARGSSGTRSGGSGRAAASLGSVRGSASYFAHPGGDIDRDGAEDVIAYEYTTHEGRTDVCSHAFTGRRGIDGAVLWTAPVSRVPCTYDGEDAGTYLLWHLVEDITGDGTADILAAVPGQGDRIYPMPPPGGCSQFPSVMAWDGSNGGVLWTWRPAESVLSVQSCHNRHSVSVMPDATGDGVRDVFVTVRMDTLTRAPYWLDGVALNGKTGTEAGRVTSVNRNQESKLLPVEDVSGDGLSDVVALTFPIGDSTQRLTAWSHSGSRHWDRPITWEGSADGLFASELTGDGLADVVIYGGDSGPGFWFPFDIALNGSDGSDLWTIPSRRGLPIGDADGDGATDLLYWRGHFEGSDPGARRTALWTASGKTGADVWGPITYPDEPGGMVSSASVDVTGDAVRDVVLYQASTEGLSARTLNGVDGSVVWEMSADAGFGQRIAGIDGDVDGDGRDDVVLLDKHLPSSSVMTVSVRAGSDGAELWSVGNLPVLPWASEDGWTSVDVWSADLQGDGSEAVIAGTHDIDHPVYSRGSVTAMADGVVLWVLADDD